LILFICRNEDDGSSEVDLIEVEAEASTMKKGKKKEKKKKKDQDTVGDLAKDLSDLTVEQGRKEKQQSKVSCVVWQICAVLILPCIVFSYIMFSICPVH
jgi:signal transduction histidine kinase